ncbi:hypothetical protein DL96DRAFT_1601177 [Flagelloscypha sp. PMI_526]|nr:hypothetical protein DL96DRAFT_1601177 [Flagelloscypha sp. PMI_526]
MDFSDSDFDLSSGSRLLSESSIGSRTGPGGDDLSLSELSIEDRSLPLFNHTGQLSSPESSRRDDDDDFTERIAGRTHEDKLMSDLAVLKNMNSAFATFNEALNATRTTNEGITEQLAQTDALLNKYIGILSKSEDFAKLILDDEWQGALADDEELEREQREEEERIKREEQERLIAAQRAQEQARRESEEKKLRDVLAQKERDRNDRAIRGTIRGVRGTRASMRGQTARAASSSGSRGLSVTQSGTAGGISSTASTRGSGLPTRGISRRS